MSYNALDHLADLTQYLNLTKLFGSSIDIYYSNWLSWLFTPLIAVSLLPGIIIIMLYITFSLLYIYKLHRYRLLDAYDKDIWDAGRKVVSAIWDALGWIWHGYEIIGIENIPPGGALLVYYHGAVPIDFYYICSHILLYEGRLINPVGDRFLFKIPGWSSLLEAFGVIPGTVQSCAALLRKGNLLAIAPGGVYEAQLGDHNYELLWRQRLGFAKVAIEAKVPIIPIFTRNIREAFRSFNVCQSFWHWLYQKTHLPLVPIYGGFPVKLTTFIGSAIPYDESHTPESLAKLVTQNMKEMINTHQSKPGNIFGAIAERFIRRKNKLSD